MIAEQLRKSILQSAIQGKLTDQLPEDGDARDLLKEIQKEKDQQIKEGKIKKEKPLPEISEDEIPFEIPDNWCWVRMGELTSLIVDGTHKTPRYVDKGVPFLSVKNISSGKFDLSNIKYITDEEHVELIKRCKPEYGDILFCRIGTLGKPIINVIDFEYSIFVSLALIKLIKQDINMYLVKYLSSPSMNEWIDKNKVGGGTHTNKINLRDLYMVPIPLPPLAEQHRIVERLDVLLPKVEKLEEEENKLATLQKSFPKKMKDSILQYAIQGKLTEQLESDGDARDLLKKIQTEKEQLAKEGKIKNEKPLPEITEDEIPFDIPENWCWVRLNECLDVRDGTHDSPKYVAQGVPLVTSKNLVNGSIDFTSAKFISTEDAKAINLRSNVDDGDILFAMIGSIGNPAIVSKDREFSIKNVALFKNIENLMNMHYVYYFLKIEQEAMRKASSGGVQAFVSLNFLRKSLIPLPPLTEQQRIVERLNRLLPLCDALE